MKFFLNLLLLLMSEASFAEDFIQIECKNDWGSFSYYTSSLSVLRGDGPRFKIESNITHQVIDSSPFISSILFPNQSTLDSPRATSSHSVSDLNNKNIFHASFSGDDFKIEVGTAYVEGWVFGTGDQFGIQEDVNNLIKQDQDNGSGKVLLVSGLYQKTKKTPVRINISFNENKDCSFKYASRAHSD